VSARLPKLRVAAVGLGVYNRPAVLYGTLTAQQPVVVQVVGQSAVRRGEVVHVQFPPAACHVFNSRGHSLAS
jgi:hypothetical protein